MERDLWFASAQRRGSAPPPRRRSRTGRPHEPAGVLGLGAAHEAPTAASAGSGSSPVACWVTTTRRPGRSSASQSLHPGEDAVEQDAGRAGRVAVGGGRRAEDLVRAAVAGCPAPDQVEAVQRSPGRRPAASAVIPGHQRVDRQRPAGRPGRSGSPGPRPGPSRVQRALAAVAPVACTVDPVQGERHPRAAPAARPAARRAVPRRAARDARCSGRPRRLLRTGSASSAKDPVAVPPQRGDRAERRAVTDARARRARVVDRDLLGAGRRPGRALRGGCVGLSSR